MVVNITGQDESDDADELTDSTQYSSSLITSSLASTTIHDATTSSASNQEDSYFSDGAWLMSKSEGQIMVVNSNVLSAKASSEEDGELKLKNILKIAPRPELGQVNQVDKSEGELASATSDVIVKAKAKQKKREKTKVHLRLSSEPTQTSSGQQVDNRLKNRIQIQPIQLSGATQVKSHHYPMKSGSAKKSSNDFERRILSSTPDSSMLFPNSSQVHFIEFTFDKNKNHE